jgi:hypothetical protein
MGETAVRRDGEVGKTAARGSKGGVVVAVAIAVE